MESFFLETITPQYFWQAASAVSTAFAAIVALSLPFLLKRMEAEQARHRILQEIRRNIFEIHMFLRLIEGQDNFQNLPEYLQDAHIDLLRSNIACTEWTELRWKLKNEVFECFRDVYSSFDSVLNAEKYHSLHGPEDFMKRQARDLVAMNAANAMVNISAIEGKCRYFKS